MKLQITTLQIYFNLTQSIIIKYNLRIHELGTTILPLSAGTQNSLVTELQKYETVSLFSMKYTRTEHLFLKNLNFHFGLTKTVSRLFKMDVKNARIFFNTL
jgi:hypothetical protein